MTAKKPKKTIAPTERKITEPPAIRKYAALQSELNDLSMAIKIHFYPPPTTKAGAKATEKAKERIAQPTQLMVTALLNKVGDVIMRLINHHFDKEKLVKLNLLQNEMDRILYAAKQNKLHMKDVPVLLEHIHAELDEEREPMVKS